MSFSGCHNYGLQAEQTLGDFLTNKKFAVISTEHRGKFSDYDLDVSDEVQGIHFTLEVKRDARARETGNIAIEVGKIVNGIPKESGLSATKADFFVYAMDGIKGFWAIEVEKLKVLVETDAKFKCQGGDFNESTLVLMDRKVYMNNSIELISYYSK